MRVLVLDDDWELLEVMARMLTEAQHEVECCNCAIKAAEMVANKTYDYVLVDYKMPDKDGIWFMKNARIPRSTTILLITAFVNREIIKKMFALGVSGYIIKPFSDEELMRHIQFHGNPAVPSIL